ncbi:sensor domain-containing diguanylate cyclase [Shewanella gelidii]|uniref:diguanylate cyclase n=1 Tax=Shewanella gelidii TaxID=1642821 RepID=A0A917JMN8_9GAMM|nr:sensor domain-containing diguanylate cyclase [Shewanella gelidii]MCL1097274.1 sensor domain-containing diguanylate cyclase [Shewanella gelidii]GGI73839.1 GGDEF domain-containing protein [Shewanella gelidii]
MQYTYEFLQQVLDAITEHIVVINERGDILFVNQTWQDFGKNNACQIQGHWDGQNYIAECDRAAASGDDFGLQAAHGIRKVIRGELDNFYFEYPCHSPTQQRWFMMRVSRFQVQEQPCFVISHQNITERKMAEQRVLDLSRLDGLTQIANRRFLDEFLQNEWSRCHRLTMPISLAILDIDHFKLLNDREGHQAGDKCLCKVATLLQQFAKRPSDLCARYGGEEFILVWGNMSQSDANQCLKHLFEALELLNIPNLDSPVKPILTLSAGLVTLLPTQKITIEEMLKVADDLLYQAKESGRDQIQLGLI